MMNKRRSKKLTMRRFCSAKQEDLTGPKSPTPEIQRNWPVITNVLTTFYYSHIGIIFPPPPSGGYVFQQTRIIFKLIQDIIKINVLTKFHEHWTINVTFRVKNVPPHGGNTITVASRVLTRFYYSPIWKNAPPPPPPGGNDDRTINVASRVLTWFHLYHITIP
ncbi:hypothetical protein DPMN_177990 [Dreissena polymorpha]|uniref:Uncharacterized protein n=1 Tax=Dreissena polymorpha TaxID=45954 RepID=A0A9D4ED86_DREPO|nr:hypothetical protein DPMN_177990 [Dreissena polymorpha]